LTGLGVIRDITYLVVGILSKLLAEYRLSIASARAKIRPTTELLCRAAVVIAPATTPQNRAGGVLPQELLE
jgi:hypothetical protein